MGYNNNAVDAALIAIGFILLLICLWLYWQIYVHQFEFAKNEPVKSRLVILSLRSAILVPGFALCFWIQLCFPTTEIGMLIPEAFFQAYAVFSFFAFTVYFVGGPSECIKIFKDTEKTEPRCLFGCVKSNSRKFYHWSYWAHWQYMFLRPPIVILSVIAGYLFGSQNNVYIALSVITFLMVCWVVLWLFKTYHVLHDSCNGLNGFWKIFIVKTTVGLTLGEGTLVQILQFFDVIPVSDTDFIVRVYSFVVMIELVILSMFLKYHFAVEMNVADKNIEIGTTVKEVTFYSFSMAFLALDDYFGEVILKNSDSDRLLQDNESDSRSRDMNPLHDKHAEREMVSITSA